LFDHHGQGERTRLFLCPGDHKITEWAHQLPTLRQNTLFSTSALEVRYSHKGLVTHLCWYQDIRVQKAHTNIKQRFTTRSVKLFALELQYRTNVSMCNKISFLNHPQEIAVTAQEKGKGFGKERDQNMSVV
jgi:hypothetical protein